MSHRVLSGADGEDGQFNTFTAPEIHAFRGGQCHALAAAVCERLAKRGQAHRVLAVTRQGDPPTPFNAEHFVVEHGDNLIDIHGARPRADAEAALRSNFGEKAALHPAHEVLQEVVEQGHIAWAVPKMGKARSAARKLV